MKLRLSFYDADGNNIERLTLPVEEARDAVSRFVVIHGTDPEAGGLGAQMGTIRFEPIRVTHTCAGCGAELHEDDINWATPDGRLTVAEGQPYCDGCLPEQAPKYRPCGAEPIDPDRPCDGQTGEDVDPDYYCVAGVPWRDHDLIEEGGEHGR